MEAAGFALGVVGAVGVLGQLLDGCLKAYRVFTVASHLGRDSERLLCKIKIEEMRLMIWGREWGVAEGLFERTIASGPANEGLRAIAEMILTQLYQTVMDLNKLQERYGLAEEAPGAVDRAAYAAAADLKSMLARGRAEGGLRLRARWVIADRDKFAAFLDDLQFYNDRLEKLFPPARVGTFTRTWTHELLEHAHRDVGALRDLQAASLPNYPALGTFAELKQLRVNLDARTPSTKILSSSELKVPRAQLTLADAAADALANPPRRSHATLKRPRTVTSSTAMAKAGIASDNSTPSEEEVPVLVEWTSIAADAADLDARLHIYQRVDNLARMLHGSSNRHPDLHTLDCLGYVDDGARARYGMLYVLPAGARAGSATSLAALLEGGAGGPTPDLDARFRLAHTIAIALWACHSLDWLHKSLSPHNVLFFSTDDHPDTASPVAGQSATPQQHLLTLKDPYIAGFDSSRPDTLTEMSAAPGPLRESELYRHPASLGAHRRTYCKAFDIYSLGLVLLELGLWKSLGTFRAGRMAKYGPAAFADKVVAGLVPALGAKAGGAYRRIVAGCLAFGDREAGSGGGGVLAEEGGGKGGMELSAHQMMEGVVQGLEALHV